MLSRKTAQAYGVLATLFAKLGDDYMVKKVSVEPYINGRESGFSIRVFGSELQAVFSENRNSDNIVLYLDIWQNFNNGNVPSDVAYHKSSHYFKPYDYAGVVDYIIKIFEITGET